MSGGDTNWIDGPFKKKSENTEYAIQRLDVVDMISTLGHEIHKYEAGSCIYIGLSYSWGLAG